MGYLPGTFIAYDEAGAQSRLDTTQCKSINSIALYRTFGTWCIKLDTGAAILNANESRFLFNDAQTESDLPHVVGSVKVLHDMSYFFPCVATRSLIRQRGEHR